MTAARKKCPRSQNSVPFIGNPVVVLIFQFIYCAAFGVPETTVVPEYRVDRIFRYIKTSQCLVITVVVFILRGHYYLVGRGCIIERAVGPYCHMPRPEFRTHRNCKFIPGTNPYSGIYFRGLTLGIQIHI